MVFVTVKYLVSNRVKFRLSWNTNNSFIQTGQQIWKEELGIYIRPSCLLDIFLYIITILSFTKILRSVQLVTLRHGQMYFVSTLYFLLSPRNLHRNECLVTNKYIVGLILIVTASGVVDCSDAKLFFFDDGLRTETCVYIYIHILCLRALLALHPPISPLTSSGQRNPASWASQPQKSVTLLPCLGGKTTQSTRTCRALGGGIYIYIYIYTHIYIHIHKWFLFLVGL